jgi:uncharacterized membrane protein YphA (DoxX/SURF4 family)
MRLVDRGIVLLLAAIFLFSGVDKIVHYQGFLNALRDYLVVPRGWAASLAPAIVILELGVGAALLFRPWRRTALATAAGVLALFSVVLETNFMLGGRGVCGCWFTLTLSKSTPLHVVQNLMLMGLALMVWWSEKGTGNRPAPPVPQPAPDNVPLGLVGQNDSSS